MAYTARRSLPPRPYGSRPSIPRPYYGTARPGLAGGASSAAGSAALGSALGALGGTLGCLLCLAALGALGLFACAIAITAYTKQFLDAYKRAEAGNSVGQLEFGLVLLCASLFYTMASRMQRS